MNLIIEMFPIALTLGTPLIITALGGLFSERSGVVNVALDGCMQIGGFVSATTLVLLSAAGVGHAIWWALLAAVAASTLFVAIHAFSSINMRADQTISGTALNVLAGGLTIYLCEILFNAKSTASFNNGDVFGRISIPVLKDIPLIGKLFFTSNYPYTYIAYVLVVIVWFFMYKTPFGLRLRSCGEYPQASASMGIDVLKTRWIGVLLSGAFAGLGGAALVLSTQTYFNSGSIHGLGFVAIATMIFGQWTPFGILGAGILFGFSQTLAFYVSSIPFLASIPSELVNMFPYVLTIIVIVLFSGRQLGPKASGEIYDPSKR